MKKKVLFVITGLGLGGAEKQLCLLADKLVQRNYDVAIVALNGEIEVTPKSNEVKLINLRMQKNPLGLLNAVLRLAKIIKDFKPQIVHGHMFHANIIARLARLIAPGNYKLVCTAHSKNEGGKVRMLAYRVTDCLCDITTNVSDEALTDFIKKKAFRKYKSRVVYNGIDTDLFKYDENIRNELRKQLNINDNCFLILAVGRLTEAKDYPNLLSAMQKLPDNYKLVIIGEGEARHQVERNIIDLQLQSAVMLLGRIMDVARYYSACDIYVSSSQWEGFGLVVAEAMSCERLVVATNAGGVAEVVGDKRFIVPISDANALASKIIEVTNSDANTKTKIMQRNRNHIVDTFSIDSIVNNWLDIYSLKQV
ncbi:glycosyltransferase [Cronobacter sakazakii]|uniref:WepF n=2 Tax=Cronobacter sakazakii TaxID=28141 RepID=I1W284_CROSK|nr:glycosyltransferase [Cronobacter sakazakii]AFI60269.1 WepF [Cronobacter sakazakii]AXX02646.1 glycosyl transferase family 1 [Cronobacter sakazakii]EGT4273475.1 glycosyltransferase [Cronobacter sakazakii]EGT4306371.1 glycosyltransferase [Cronobacter sakazakii]EGT4325701.1 glycosyltransferase [Cronobacter sakazakii]